MERRGRLRRSKSSGATVRAGMVGRSAVGGENQQQLQSRERSTSWAEDNNFNTRNQISVPLRSYSTADDSTEGWAPPNFNSAFQFQVKNKSIKLATPQLISNIQREVARIRLVMNGHIPTNVRPDVKFPVEIMSDDEPTIPLVPKSQWVYETPDKQRMKKMEELNLNMGSIFEPAVLQNSKKIKTIYEIDDGIKKKVDMDMVDGGQEVPIDLGYLKPLCTVNVSGNEDDESNQFLAHSEETVSFGEVLHIDRSDTAKIVGGVIPSRKRTIEESNDETWYDRHMKVLATCRPSKPTEKVSRRSYLQKRSLSFENESSTPNTQSYKNGRFISMNEFNSPGVGQLDENAEFGDFYKEESPMECSIMESTASPELSKLMRQIEEIPAITFYPANQY